jgi:hypothetical protein
MDESEPRIAERRLRMRPLRMDDFDALIAMQLRSFPGMRPWKHEQIASQLEIFPEGQIAIEVDGRLAASSSSLIVDSSAHTDWHDWKIITDDGYIRTHDPLGDMLYGIEIMVDPEFRGMKLSRRLCGVRKRLARDRNLRSIIIGGRIPGYGEHGDQMTATEYVQKVISKSLVDPVLTPQLSNGFVLKGLIPNYFPGDQASRAFVTHLEWTNLDYAPAHQRRLMRSTTPVRLSAVVPDTAHRRLRRLRATVQVLRGRRLRLQGRLPAVPRARPRPGPRTSTTKCRQSRSRSAGAAWPRRRPGPTGVRARPCRR